MTKVPPNIGNVAEGWRPTTKTETTVMGTRKMLTDMGVPDDEITKVLATIDETRAFQGSRSPFEPTQVNTADVAPQSLTPDELGTVLKHFVGAKGKVQMVYGSTTIKPQLDPKLRNWRKLGDVEAQLKIGVTEDEAAKLAQSIVDDLNKQSPGKFSIDPKDPKRIMTEGHHAVELKLAQTSETGVEAQYNLTRTGEMSWGMKVAEKPITVEYPGAGKLDIMRLSESGVRKADSITRATGDGTFAPPAHRVKDVADYYVILYTFKGEKVANSWAKLCGYDAGTLAKAAAKDPPRLDAWVFSPEKVKGASPSVRINLPGSLAATAQKASPSVYAQVTSPMTGSSAATSVANAISDAARSVPVSGMAGSVSSKTSVAAASSKGSSQGSTKAPSGSAGVAKGSERKGSTGATPKAGKGGGGKGKPTGGKPAPSTTGSLSGSSTSSGGGAGSGMTGGQREYPMSSRAAIPGRKGKQDISGEVQWKQGRYWIKVTPPAKEGERHRNVQYSREPFWGVKVLKGSPEKTFVSRGDPPDQFLYEMGVTSIDIFPHTKPHLRYRRTKAGRSKIRRRRGRVL